MADPIFGLTLADVQKLKWVVQTLEGRGFNYGRATRPEDDPPAPETYVVLTPAGGIPARSGTTPGAAECELYTITNRETDSRLLVPTTTKTILVHNLSANSIPGDEYIPVNRDKYGSWLAGPPPGESTPEFGQQTASSTVISAATGVWTSVTTGFILEAPHTYEVKYQLTGKNNGNTLGDYLVARLTKYSGSCTPASFQSESYFGTIVATGVDTYFHTAGTVQIQVSSDVTFDLQIKRVFSGSLTTTLFGGSEAVASGLSYVKLSS